MNNKQDKKKFRYVRIPGLFKQLIADLKPVPERLNLEVNIKELNKSKIKQFCEKNNDLDAFKKMMIHELSKEPTEKVIAIIQQNGTKIKKRYINRLLEDLGYNVNVLFSKSHGSDYEAATNVGGYSIPGWGKLIELLRKLNNNIAIFLGKRQAPGKSRLHIRIFEGNTYWYIIAHIDKFNWMIFNIFQMIESHVGSGAGDYKHGTEYFLRSLEHYFGDNCKIVRIQS